MVTIDLETVRENLEFGLEEFRRLPRPSPPEAEWAEASLMAWRRARRLGIAVLLVDADTQGCKKHLIDAARIRRDLLASTATAPAHFAAHRHCGDLAGFVDALAAGDAELASKIAALSTAPWHPDHEYEDDYWFARILHSFVVQDQSQVPDPVLFDHLVQAAENEPTGQVLVAHALRDRDPDGFGAGLAARAAEHCALFDRKAAGVVADPEEMATERHVFVEGIGLRFLASRLGISVAPERPMMPAMDWGGGT